MKISGLQIFWMMFTFETGNMLLSAISPTIAVAKQDAWISYLIASMIGILIVFIATKASLLYPSQTFIEFSQTILGKWIGSIIVIIYLIQWYSIIGIILRGFGDFTITLLFSSTPSWLVLLTMVMLMIYVTYSGGIEGIGRCSEVFGIMVILMVVLLILLSIPNMDVHKVLPVLADSGLSPILKGTLTPVLYLGESVMIMMFVSFMAQPTQALSKAIWGVALSAFFVSMATFSVLMIFGPVVAAKLKFPAFDAFSYISVMGFMQNLQIIAILVWILSVFIKLSLYLFIASYGTAQWLKIKDWRKVIWVVAVLGFVQALLYPNITYTRFYMEEYRNYFLLPVNMIGIPCLLWLVGSIRKAKQKGLS